MIRVCRTSKGSFPKPQESPERALGQSKMIFSPVICNDHNLATSIAGAYEAAQIETLYNNSLGSG